MTVRGKAFVIVLMATLVLVGGLYVYLRRVVLDSYLRLEEESARRDLDRGLAAVSEDAAQLHATCRDYAVWDETYAFAGGDPGSERYVAVNFVDETFKLNRLSSVAVVDGAGRLRWSKGPLPAELPRGLDPTGPDVKGVVETPGGPLLIAAHPILPSSRVGQLRGTLVMGRLLDDDEVARLAKTLSLKLTIRRATDPPPQPIQRLDGSRLAAHATIEDLGGRPYLTARVELPRDVYARGLAALRSLVLAVGLAGLAFGATVVLLLDRVVLRALFGRYVSENVARAILSRPEAAELGGEQRVVTILFSDLRGYSTITEHMAPPDVVVLLNEYFAAMSAVIEAEGGVVIELIGDGMLAVFNAPQDLPDHAERAVQAAMTMHRREAELNRAWEAAGRAGIWKDRGIEAITSRIGLHTGTVVAGNLGGETRMKYTVIGDAVNLAARIEALNGKLGTDLLFTEEVRARLGPTLTTRSEPRGEHIVKGRNTPVRVHTITS